MAKKHNFECVALLLQGGGALGSYQAGVYQALHEAGIEPNLVAGISIGAINSALIAGNPSSKRLEALQTFWDRITSTPMMPNFLQSYALGAMGDESNALHGFINQANAMGTIFNGANGFFTPRMIPPFLAPKSSDNALSFYDTSPLHETLNELVDFDLINSKKIRFSVGAVNVTTGNFEYFDNDSCKIDARHIMASGALPPGFPAVEIDGQHYWDGGVVSNTPLEWLLDSVERQDTLAFQIDLWSAKGDYPADLTGQDLRLKDIRYSSRTRQGTDRFKESQKLRRAFARLLKNLPKNFDTKNDPELNELLSLADDKVYNIAHLIYRAKSYEGNSKDYEFSRATMEDHWGSGYADAQLTLQEPGVLKLPTNPSGVGIFDVTAK